MAEGMFIPQWQRKESEASLESDSWGFYCVLGATFNKLSWYSVKGCGLHQKPFSVTKSTRREKHTYTVPGAAERGATREVQAGGSSRLTRGSRGPAAQSSPLVVGGWQTDPPSADSSGTPRLHFSLPPTPGSVLPNLELSEPPPPPQSTDQKHYTSWVTLTSFAKCIPPGLSRPSAGEVQGVDKKPVWGLRGYIYELWVLEQKSCNSCANLDKEPIP